VWLIKKQQNMKRNIFYILSLILLPMMVMGQFQEVNVPFSDMSKRGKLVVNVKMGPVTVVGTGRQDVLVKYKSGEGKELGFEEAKGGLKRISGGFAGIEITEKNNEVYVGSQSWTKSIVLEIEVPQDIDIKLDAHNFGDINVDNIKGEVAIKSFNGSINAENISGSLVASTYAGGLKASFNSVTPDTPLSWARSLPGLTWTSNSRRSNSRRAKTTPCSALLSTSGLPVRLTAAARKLPSRIFQEIFISEKSKKGAVSPSGSPANITFLKGVLGKKIPFFLPEHPSKRKLFGVE